jgi:hypothetical protein
MEKPIRKNGLQRPFHLFQIISWALQVFNIISIYCTTLPCLKTENRIPIGVLFIFFQSITIIVGYKLTASVPSDRTVIIFHNSTDKE